MPTASPLFVKTGGELGIRTPEGTLWPLTRLAGEHLRPLGQLSVRWGIIAQARVLLNEKPHSQKVSGSYRGKFTHAVQSECASTRETLASAPSAQ
jgi:hypothetical protein